MHKIRIRFWFMLFLLIQISCKEHTSPEEESSAEKTDTTKLPVMPLAYEPASPTPVDNGIAVFGKEKIKIVTTYTDSIVFIQKVVDANGFDSTLNYRQAIVNLINTKGDTVKFKQQDFKKFIPYDAYLYMILQAAVTNVKIKKGNIPLMISLCIPDSDYCFDFETSMNKQGAYDVREINEDEFDDIP